MSEFKSTRVVKFGNSELDRRIGGIPLPTLCLVEGASSAGKSVFVQAVAYGALSQGYSVHYITTEDTIRGLLNSMKSLSFNCDLNFLSWQFSVTSVNVRNIRWDAEISRRFLETLMKFVEFLHEVAGKEVIIVDNISHFIATASEQQILEFFSHMRDCVDERGIAVFLTLHPFVVNEDLLVRIRSVCDGNIMLEIKEMGEQMLRVMKVIKLRGATKRVDITIGFVVDPVFGIKVIPISGVKV
jgi:flagellar protein FlaH